MKKLPKIKFNKMGLALKKKMPEILIVTGGVGIVTATVMACKATRKLDPVMDEHKERINNLHVIDEDGEEIKPAAKEIVVAYGHTALDIAKLYGPSVVLGGLSLGMVLTSNNILRKRNAALAASYIAIEKEFKQYRQNVIDKFGTETDKEMYYGIKTETVTDPETGKKVKVKTSNVKDGDVRVWFTKENSPYFENDTDYNLYFLKGQQSIMNDILRSKGKIFLNEAREMLGFDDVVSGQSLGWIYDKDDPDFCNTVIDLGIFEDGLCKSGAEFKGNEVLITFNVCGNILDLMVDEENE